MKDPEIEQFRIHNADASELDETAEVISAAYMEYASQLPSEMWDQYHSNMKDVRSRLGESELIVAIYRGRIAGAVTFYPDGRLREGRANTARGAAHFLRETVGRVRYAGANGRLTLRADSGFYTHGVVSVCRKMDVRFSITIRQHKSLHNLIEAIPGDAWTPIPYWMDGAADVAETTCTPFQAEADAAPVRLIVRRVKPAPGSQLALFAKYSYHGFITDRDGELLELEADHRRHAEIENAIRDLKYGVGLNHLPSGRFAANGAWLAVQTMAHNLARWTARIGLGERIATTKTLRRRFFSLAGRLTRSARRLTLHLPDRWPWAEKFSRALARLRAIPLPA